MRFAVFYNFGRRAQTPTRESFGGILIELRPMMRWFDKANGF